MFEKKSLNIYSVIVGMLFIISGFGKAIDTAGFSDLISQYGLGYLMVLSPLIVVSEILIGLFLVLLINPRFFAMISFFMLTIFTVLFAFAHFKYGVNDCGCFGTVQHLNFPPLISFIRNIILIVMSGMIWWGYPRYSIKIAKWKLYLISSIIAVSIFISGFTFEIPYSFKNKSEIHEFQGQNIKNTELSKYLITSPDSTYLFFVFSYTCPYCWNSIENLRQYQKSGTVDRMIAFATGAESDKDIFNQSIKPDFIIKNLSADEIGKLTDSYPTAFYIEHDTVKLVLQSELPSPFIFKRYLE